MIRGIFELTQKQKELLSAIRDRFSIDITIEQYDLIDMRITATCLNDGKVYTTYRYYYDPNNHLVMSDLEFKATLDTLFAYIVLVYLEPEHENIEVNECEECEECEDEDEEEEEEDLNTLLRRVRNMHDISQIQSEYNKAELECVADMIARSDNFQKMFDSAFQAYKLSSIDEELSKDRIIQVINYVIECEEGENNHE